MSYSKVTATLALVLAIGGGTVYAADKIRSGDIASNAIKSKHIKKNAVRGKDVKESTLGQVPDAASVGGVTVTPVDASIPATADASATLIEVGSSNVTMTCDPDFGELLITPYRGPSGDTLVGISLEAQRNNVTAPEQAVERPEPNSGVGLNSEDMVEGTVTFREKSGAVSRLEVTAIREPGAFGGSDVCFASGTISSFGG